MRRCRSDRLTMLHNGQTHSHTDRQALAQTFRQTFRQTQKQRITMHSTLKS